MKLTCVYLIVYLLTPVIHSDTTVTIYHEWLAQGGRYRYEWDRWNKHNSLERINEIQLFRNIGTECGRWIHPDFAHGLFPNWPEDPHRKGYPDPNHLKNASLQRELFSAYMDNINTGLNNTMVADMNVQHWPNWIDKSEHKGMFPNDLDAASEFMVLLVQGIHDYTKGNIPPYFEVMNEPYVKQDIFNSTTIASFYKIVADKLHSKFKINVAGPTNTGFSASLALKDFKRWQQIANFIDVNKNSIDRFSFHSYNGLTVSGKSHSFDGMNEARLVAFVDQVENYYINKYGKQIPIIISEYGRGSVKGLNDSIPSPIIDFATIYHSNAHRFTQLGLREYIDRSVLFVAQHAKDRQLFNWHGVPTRVVDIYKFWQNFTSDHRFVRTSSSYDSKERLISPLVLSNPVEDETIVMLHSYAKNNQRVTLNFKHGWNVPKTGEAMCITLMNNWYPNITHRTFDLTKTNGKVNIRPEETCQIKFKTSFDPGTLTTVNEKTYYGADMIIPVDKDLVKKTIIKLPHAGYHAAKLRVGITLPVNATKHITKVTLNSNVLNSFYMLFDSDKYRPDTISWNVWEFHVQPSLLHVGNNAIRVYFSNSQAGGYVSSVALVTGTVVPTDGSVKPTQRHVGFLF